MSKEKETKTQEINEIAKTSDDKVVKTKAKKETKKFSRKKLPRIFKKKYTEKKINKKIYSKIFVPEDKKFLQSIFVECERKGKKNIPIFAVPNDATFTKKQIKRLKALKKEMKKQKGRIKFLPLIATVSFICIIFFAITLTKNFIIKKAITSVCESIFEAKCDIALVELKFLDSSFKMKKFEIANKKEPMKNLVYVDSVMFDFDLLQLLKARFVADELSITGVATNTDRAYSGDLAEKKLKKIQKKKEKQAKKANKDLKDSPLMKEVLAKTSAGASIVENSFIDLFNQYNPENIINNCYAQLQSPALAQDVKTKTTDMIKKWEAVPANFEKKVKDLQASSDRLMNFDFGSIESNPTKIKGLIEDFNTVLESTKELKSQTEKTVNDIKGDFNTIQDYSSKIQTSIKHDLNIVNKEISKFTSLGLDDGTQFFTVLFEKVMLEMIGKNYHYVKKVTELLDNVKISNDKSKKSDKKEEQKTVETKKRGRLPGRNVVYRNDTTPKFWIKKAAGSGPNFAFEGNHISSNMDGIGKAASVNANLDLAGIEHKANVILDLRTKSSDPMVTADYSGNNFTFNLSSDFFGNEPGVPDIKSKTKLSVVAKVHENDGFELAGTAFLRDMNVTAVPFEPKFAYDIYAGVLSQIKETQVQVTTGFDLSSGLKLKINSDIDKQVFSAFSKELKVQLSSITKKAQAELSEKVKEMTNGAISEINLFNDINSKINSSDDYVDSIKKQLESKKSELEEYLTKQINSKVDEAKKEVENKLKDNAKDVLKKLW